MKVRVFLAVLFFVQSSLYFANGLFADDIETIDRVSSVSILSGKIASIGDVTIRDNDVKIVERASGADKKYFWNLHEDDQLTLNAKIPKDATNVSMRIHLFVRKDKNGAVKLRWDDSVFKLLSEQDKKVYEISVPDVKNDLRLTEKIYFDKFIPDTNNKDGKYSFKFIGKDGEVGIEGIELRFEIPRVSWLNDSVRVILLEPERDQIVAKGNKIDLRWNVSGEIQPEGWIKIEYRNIRNDKWNILPNAEAIANGSKEWKSGTLSWQVDNADSDADKLEFRILYSNGINPVIARQQEKQKQEEQKRNTILELIELKRKFVVDAITYFRSDLWAAHDRNNYKIVLENSERIDSFDPKSDISIVRVTKILTESDLSIFKSLVTVSEKLLKDEEVKISDLEQMLEICEKYVKKRESFIANGKNLIAKLPANLEGEKILNQNLPEFNLSQLKDFTIKFNSKIAQCYLDKKRADYKIDNIDKAIKILTTTAEQNDPQAQILLGDFYYNDESGKKDFEKAFNWYKKAAEQGHAEAQFNLGNCYCNGEGVAKDSGEAFKWYKKAAEQGHANAQCFLGICYTIGQDVTKDLVEAARWWKKAAEQGEMKAQCIIGHCYMRGDGVTKDFDEAFKWYEKAAEQGDAVAQCNLGFRYAKGEGVTKNLTEAFKWFKKAAEQGDAMAQCYLGHCYYKGEGVSKDFGEAVKLFRKAAEQGNASYAQVFLGHCYYKGKGVSKDFDEAFKWYEKAAEQGHKDAQYFLGDCYYNGEGVSKDFGKAFKWYEKSAKQGHAEAQNSLGYCYKNGMGVNKDNYEAFKWYKKAAEQNLPKAQFNLARCYDKGEGVTRNTDEAVKWFRKAAEQGHEGAKKALEGLGKRLFDFL
jgi:TPR repeat protein